MSSSTTDVLVDVLLPAMGTSISEGTLVAWSKAVGDAVAIDETICEVSTDKVDTECPSPATGILAEIVVEPGETVDVGTVIARLAVAGDAADGAAPSAPDVASPPRADLPPTDAERHAGSSTAASPSATVPAPAGATRRWCSESPRRTSWTSTRSAAPAATAA